MHAEKFLWIKKLKASHKVFLCAVIGVIVFVCTYPIDKDIIVPMLISWDVFCLIILVLDWIIFWNTPSKQIRKQAQVEDGSRFAIFIIVLVATLASLLAVTILLIHSKGEHKALHITVAVIGMTFSWLLVHTLFTVRYAHIYYGDHKEKEDSYAGGLDFPGEDEKDHPDFIDFAYFSFVLGMTFQVSDVQITSKRLRRLVLIHSLVSFIYNTGIVALTINTLAGLTDK